MEKNYIDGFIKVLETNDNRMEYLVKRILLNSSAVLLGCKPASTITFTTSSSNLNQYSLWNIYKYQIQSKSKLVFFELHKDNKNILILAYDRKKLIKTLSQSDTRFFLNYLGYSDYLTIDEKLEVMSKKFLFTIPHEIGLFLGLPLKDVMGFMGLNKLKLSCCAGWKIYGNAVHSLLLSSHYEDCRIKMIKMLIECNNAVDILNRYPLK